MDLLDQELEPDAFVWEASAPVEAEESEESQERVAFEVMTLRNVALEALNTDQPPLSDPGGMLVH